VYGGREVELFNVIGQQLRAIIPPSAATITANGEAGDDWADVGFEFRDEAGAVGHFSFEDNPGDTSDEISEALMELHEVMASNGRDKWNRFAFTVDREGQFDVSFSYQDGDGT